MHRENLVNCATIASQNLKLNELKGVNYAFTCSECDEMYIQKTAALTQIIDQNCMKCYKKMSLEFFSHQTLPIVAKLEVPQLGKKPSSNKKK